MKTLDLILISLHIEEWSKVNAPWSITNRRLGSVVPPLVLIRLSVLCFCRSASRVKFTYSSIWASRRVAARRCPTRCTSPSWSDSVSLVPPLAGASHRGMFLQYHPVASCFSHLLFCWGFFFFFFLLRGSTGYLPNLICTVDKPSEIGLQKQQ